MVRIFWYKLKINDSQVIRIPKDSKILSILHKEPEDFIRIYTKTDPDVTELDQYQFEILGTGHGRHNNLNEFTFLGTVTMMSEALVFHVFYKKL